MKFPLPVGSGTMSPYCMWMRRFCRSVGPVRVRSRVLAVRSSGVWVVLERLDWVTQPRPVAWLNAEPMSLV